MSKTRSEVLKESKQKGLAAAAATSGACIFGAMVGSPVVAIVAAVPGALLTWQWWKHRAENGIRF